MVPFLLSCLFSAALIFLVIVLILRKKAFSAPGLLGLFFIGYFLDNFIIALTNRTSILQVIPNHIWEGSLVCGWSGKLYSMIAMSALIYSCRSVMTVDEIGLTLRQRTGSLLPALIVVLSLASWALVVGLRSPHGKFDFNTLLYLAVMPGLNEELVYRGYLMAVSNKLMPSRFKLFGASFGWGALVTSLLFGLLHGVWFDGDLSLQFSRIAFRNAAVSGFTFAWLRERTGSLFVPILAHGLEDVLFFLPRMISF